MQYGRKCLLCKNTRQRERGCRLFKFPPRGSPMWLRWLEACGLQAMDIDASSREPPRLCQRHFQKKDFLTRQLTGMAVPSLFPEMVLTEINVQQVTQQERYDQEFIESEILQDEADISQQQVIEEMCQLAEVALPKEDHLDSLIEYSGSIPDSLDGELIIDAEIQELPSVVAVEDLGAVSELSFETEQGQIDDEPGGSCNISEHSTLLEELQNERTKVELLSNELLEKDKVIGEQYELLKQLGVQFVTFAEG